MNSFFRLIIWLFVFRGLFLIELTVIADEATLQQQLEKLLNSPKRPTVSEVIKTLDPWPENNPFKSLQATTSDSLLKRLPEFYDFIAQFEWAYPGAVYAPLGRDVVLIGDILDAFYLSIGQPGRVSRINASGNSFRNLGDNNIVKLIRGAGFDFDHFEQQRPFIIFDFTKYGSGSQSTTIMQAVYDELVKNRSKPLAQVLQKFNLISLNPGINVGQIKGNQGRKQFFESILQQLNGRLDIPNSIIHVPMVRDDVLAVSGNEAGRCWHGPFDNFIPTTNGGVEGRPGALYDVSTRETILFELYEIIQRVAQPDFLQGVQNAARSMGYEFPLDASSIQTLDGVLTTARNHFDQQNKFDFEKLTEDYKNLVSNLNVTGEKLTPEQPYFSTNGQQLASWLNQTLNLAVLNDHGEKTMMLFIEGILQASKVLAITSLDKRRLMALALANLHEVTKGEPSEEFYNWFKALYDNNTVLHKLWHKRQDYFQDQNPKRHPKGKGHLVPLMFTIISKKLNIDLTVDVVRPATGGKNCQGGFDGNIWGNLK